MKFNKPFFTNFALIGIQVLFFLLLYRHLSSLFFKLVYREPSVLNNLTEERVEDIKASIKSNLDEKNLRRSLYRYFVFFYIDDYQSRQYFIAAEGTDAPTAENQKIVGDPFYTSMLSYHLNDVCYLINTVNINPQSSIYSKLLATEEVDPSIFYVSCPVFIDDVLVGYIGGLNKNEDGSNDVETAAVKNAARNIGTILSE